MPDDKKIREIREQLSAIAPLPSDGPVPALALARHMAVSALERYVRQMGAPASGIDHAQIAVLVTEFAAATALYALAATEHRGAELPLGIEPAVPRVLRDMKPGEVAAFIRDCLEDGDTLGEFLWEFLGKETAETVSRLAGEMAEAAAEKPKPASDAVTA